MVIPMREMKGSGIEWAAVIPKEWQLKRIKYLMVEKKIKTSNGSEERALSVTQDKGIIRSIDTKIANPSSNYDDYVEVKTGDLVFNKYKAHSGVFFVTPYDGIVTFNYSVYRCNKSTNPKFCEYLFKTAGCIAEFNKRLHGVGESISPLYTKDLFDICIPVPPIEEQKRIVSFLDIKCTEVDSLSADIQSEIDYLQAYKRSVITEAVTHGLDKTVPMKDSGIEWASNIPSHWKVMKNKYIMTKIKDICPVYNGEDILSLTMNGVIVRDLNAGGKMPTSFNGYQKLYPNNLLMCLFDYDVTPRCIGLVKNEGLTSPAYSQFKMKDGNRSEYYYYYYLMIDFTKELLHLAKNLRHSFTEDQLGAIVAPVPPISEQIAIAKYLDKKCIEIEKIIIKKQEQLEVLAEYKKSVIYEYVTGKKEVPANG